VANIQRRPDGRWRARYRTRDGKERARHFARRADAERWVAQQEAALVRGDWIDPALGRRKLESWVVEWRANLVDVRPSTLARTDSVLRTHIVPRFGHRPLAAIDHVEISAWVAELSQVRAAATVRRTYQVLHQVLDRYRAMVLVGAWGGLRIGELCGLKRHRVSVDRRRLEIAEIVVDVGGTHHWGQPKTKAGRRRITLARFVASELQVHLDRWAGSELVFTAPEGGLLSRNHWRARYWQPAVNAANLAPLRPHDLRHTAVALWIASGANPLEISRRAGHSSVAFTLDRYGHLFENADEAVADRLDDLYGSNGEGGG